MKYRILNSVDGMSEGGSRVRFVQFGKTGKWS